MAVVGGGAAIAISLLTFILPTIERTFGIVTGMTLIELRDTKHPLLRELQQRAPGTYNHSLTVATIAEAAADSIHVNGLELYVGALYHDVGKMNKPDYFIENQKGINPHDELQPRMSALILISHVKDGLELAKGHKLGREITDIIQQHHGTSLISYFYQKALERAGKKGGKATEVEEEDFRYPGPKPQTNNVDYEKKNGKNND